MKGVCLQFFMSEFQKYHEMLLFEWLLERAKKQGIPGGSAFRAIAGYGRHGIMHEEHFFELASNVPITVIFFLQREEAQNFVKTIKDEGIHLFYAISETEFGTIEQ